jgi:hypothetical protein
MTIKLHNHYRQIICSVPYSQPIFISIHKPIWYLLHKDCPFIYIPVYFYNLYCQVSSLHTLYFLFEYWGWDPDWVHSALRSLLAYCTCPGWLWDGEVGRMNGFGRGNRSTRRKPAPTPLCPPQIPLARPGREPGPPRYYTPYFFLSEYLHIFLLFFYLS